MTGVQIPPGEKLDLMHVLTPRPINVNGQAGEKCAYCSGYGFTIWITDGKAHYCGKCNYTGVEPERSK